MAQQNNDDTISQLTLPDISPLSYPPFLGTIKRLTEKGVTANTIRQRRSRLREEGKIHEARHEGSSHKSSRSSIKIGNLKTFQNRKAKDYPINGLDNIKYVPGGYYTKVGESFASNPDITTDNHAGNISERLSRFINDLLILQVIIGAKSILTQQSNRDDYGTRGAIPLVIGPNIDGMELTIEDKKIISTEILSDVQLCTSVESGQSGKNIYEIIEWTLEFWNDESVGKSSSSRRGHIRAFRLVYPNHCWNIWSQRQFLGGVNQGILSVSDTRLYRSHILQLYLSFKTKKHSSYDRTIVNLRPHRDKTSNHGDPIFGCQLGGECLFSFFDMNLKQSNSEIKNQYISTSKIKGSVSYNHLSSIILSGYSRYGLLHSVCNVKSMRVSGTCRREVIDDITRRSKYSRQPTTDSGLVERNWKMYPTNSVREEEEINEWISVIEKINSTISKKRKRESSILEKWEQVCNIVYHSLKALSILNENGYQDASILIMIGNGKPETQVSVGDFINI